MEAASVCVYNNPYLSPKSMLSTLYLAQGKKQDALISYRHDLKMHSVLQPLLLTKMHLPYCLTERGKIGLAARGRTRQTITVCWLMPGITLHP